MFLIFEDYKINEIIDNIREFIHISDFLFSGLEKGTQQILVMRPENIYSCYSELYCMWLKIVEKLNYVKSKAVTPGQFCVLYDGNICLGGGIIKEVIKED